MGCFFAHGSFFASKTVEYDSRMGIAYDTMWYGFLCFNFKEFKRYTTNTYGIVKTDYKFFKYLSNIVPAPPSTLYPFYYCDFTKPSFMSNLFYENFLFGQDDFLGFKQRMINDNPSFLQSLFQYYFGDREDYENLSSAEEFINRILELDVDHELIIQLIHFWSNYHSVLQELNNFLTTTYEEIEKLYKKEAKLICNTLRIFTTKHFIEHLNVLPTIEYADASTTDKVAISLLNEVSILQKRTLDTSFSYILGLYCDENLDLQQNCYKISLEVLCKAFKDEAKRDILLLLNEKEYTVTQLSKKIYESRQAVNRHILWLLDLMFIKVSHRAGTEVYYKINYPFFLAAKGILNEFLEIFIEKGVSINEIMEEANH